ncbi:MMPL family transporter [Alkalihalobacillus sp. AL-G]|uniref:MMPL family transporter n=1 Tax=Alkalihalobacillus sp. AL-G TaxID=2926399 RepID=UPI00272AED5E|nr:MMPL family transporter [Alkalihalobacillus sp. AL-G]WLD91538.1 MMPL family transporter [Alkalihalobacillus sp. AL-G]
MKKSYFDMLSSFVFRFKKTVVAIWVFCAVLLTFFAFQLPSVLHGSGFETEGSFQKTHTILHDQFEQPKSTMILVFESNTYETDTKEFQTHINHTLDKLSGVDHLDVVTSPVDNPKMSKGNTAYAVLGFDRSFTDLKNSIEQIRSKIDSSDDFTVRLTGGPVIAEDMNKASQDDLKHAEAIGIPAALIILLFAFGGITAAIIPIVIGLISVLSTMGLLYFASSGMDMSIFLLNVVPMIGLALGIDFALLLVNRFREEMKKGSVERAVSVSLKTAGRSIAFSGLCVFLGLSSMLIIDINIFQTVAIGGMFVVVLSVVCALTFLPALLGLLGERVNKWMILKQKSRKNSSWYRFAKFVMRRPIIMFTLTLLILLTAIIPITNLKMTIPEAEALPSSYDSRQAFETFKSTFGEQELYPVTMIVDADGPISSSKNLNSLGQLEDDIKQDTNVKRISSFYTETGLTPDQLKKMISNNAVPSELQPVVEQFIQKDKAIIRVYLNVNSTSEQAKDWVREWDGGYESFQLILGGNSKFTQEIFDEIYQKAPFGIGFVLITTYFILMFAFRSLFIPLKAIVMNVVSLCATFGLVVWIFQEGHFTDPTNGIGLMIPVLTFGIVFGLSMDYEVFLISRIQEYYHESKDNNNATLLGLTSTSKIITSAALIMIVVTGAFAFTGVVPVKQMGVSVALAILIDATLVRMILVPSLMKLMGDWNWWVPSLKRKQRIRENE